MKNTTPFETVKTINREGKKVLSRKRFGEIHGLKGAELKRRHYEYLLSNPLSDMVQNVTWSRVTRNPKTGHVSASGYDAAAMAKKAPKAPRRRKAKVEIGRASCRESG